jgi:hypothetical protein
MNSISPREFLESVTSEQLLKAYFRSKRVIEDSAPLAGEETFLENLIEQTEKLTPGVFDFFRMVAQESLDDGAGDDFMAGMVAGSIIIARTVYLVAEQQELPEL